MNKALKRTVFGATQVPREEQTEPEDAGIPLHNCISQLLPVQRFGCVHVHYVI